MGGQLKLTVDTDLCVPQAKNRFKSLELAPCGGSAKIDSGYRLLCVPQAKNGFKFLELPLVMGKLNCQFYSINKLFFLIMADCTCVISLQNVSTLRLHISYKSSIKFETTAKFGVLFDTWK